MEQRLPDQHQLRRLIHPCSNQRNVVLIYMKSKKQKSKRSRTNHKKSKKHKTSRANSSKKSIKKVRGVKRSRQDENDDESDDEEKFVKRMAGTEDEIMRNFWRKHYREEERERKLGYVTLSDISTLQNRLMEYR